MYSLKIKPAETPTSLNGKTLICDRSSRYLYNISHYSLRMQSEHPVDEANTVIIRGRVLGGLEPTRAFGDARYKWSREAQAM